MIKIDLHTHSIASPDGSLALEDYRAALESGRLDVIAITDHNTTEFALETQKELGEAIIIGEEIDTLQGEIIGLYLTAPVPSGLTLTDAVAAILDQGGLVYIPHPFETVRHGVADKDLATIEKSVDIIETFNGRAYGNRARHQAQDWVRTHRVATAASSDAHGKIGWGKTYSAVGARPTRETLVNLLKNRETKHGETNVNPAGLLYPKLNRLRKALQSRHA